VDAMRAAVRKHFVCGVEHQAVDHIKIFVSGSIATLPLDSEPWRSYFTKEEIFVAAEEAHRMKKPVAAHCHGGEGADWCIEAGIDSIEHGAWLSLLQLEKMAAKGIAWVPTLAIIFKPRPPEHPRIMAKREDAQKRLKENIRKALEMGVKIVAGTDNLHGMLWNELQWMVNFGMPPMAALLTATKGAAELCRKGETIGTIEPGKFADLIAVKDDPLSDISCLKNVIFVMKDGKRYELPE
jgi:imidazolonepropionase-like amidohydrolase